MTPPPSKQPPSKQPPKQPAATPTSRRRREVLIALLALPVLLVLGLLAGNALTGDSTDVVASDGATSQVPAVQGPTVPDRSGATSTPATVPTTSPPAAPATTAPSTAPPTTAVTTAPPTTAPPTTPPTTAPPTTPPTTAPATTTPPTTAPPTTAPPRAAPTTPPPPPPGEPAAGSGAAPAPQAGPQLLLFRGNAGPDVRTWQAQMAERGWRLKVDGIFGPRTETVLRQFQAQKGLRVDGLLGPNSWDAAWTRPVT